MNVPDESTLIYDWAGHGPRRGEWSGRVMVDDETLRDGLQSPSVTDPPAEVKVRILHLMESLGIDTADIGLPGAGTRQREAVTRLCREIADNRMKIRANCAARTMMVDIQPIAEVTADHRRADRGVRLHRKLAHPAVRRGVAARFHPEAVAGGDQLRGEGRPRRHVRHRGHGAVLAGGSPHAPDGRGRRGSQARLPLRHVRCRDPARRVQPRLLGARI